MTGTILYFAYGPNMLEERLRRRCPSARAITSARLTGWSLNLHKRSKDGSGKANLEPSRDPTAFVHGVLYELDGHDLEALDRFEGHGMGYDRHVIAVENESSGAATHAFAYLVDANSIDRSLLPYDWYLALVISGAREHHLPEPYVAQLTALRSAEDPIPDRATRIEALELLHEALKS